MKTKEERVFLRATNLATENFLNDIPQIHYLWQLYYSADAKVNNPHPLNPNAKTFKDWLIHLTPEEYEYHVERYKHQTGWEVEN